MKSYLEAKNAKELCKLLKLTQAQAATKAGVGRTVITAIVNGNLESISKDRQLEGGVFSNSLKEFSFTRQKEPAPFNFGAVDATTGSLSLQNFFN